MGMDEENKPQEIMIPEAKFILDKQIRNIQEKRSVEDKKFLNEVYAYLKKQTKIMQENSVIELKTDLEQLSLTNEEIAQIGSLMPQTTEELKILIPSLNRLPLSDLNEITSKIQRIN